MKPIMELLLELQDLQLSAEPLSLEVESKMNALRPLVAKPILDHFDRLIVQGKTGVAKARDGVCGECHLRICSGTFAILTHRTDLCLCDNCGRYLYLPPSGSEGATEKSAKKRFARAGQSVLV
jgi:hypothetical protein